MKYKKILTAAVGFMLIGILAACGTPTHQDAPDPSGPSIKDAQNLRTLNMPDGFRNVAYGCDQFGNLVYVTSAGNDDTRPSGIFVLPNDPHCK